MESFNIYDVLNIFINFFLCILVEEWRSEIPRRKQLESILSGLMIDYIWSGKGT